MDVIMQDNFLYIPGFLNGDKLMETLENHVDFSLLREHSIWKWHEVPMVIAYAGMDWIQSTPKFVDANLDPVKNEDVNYYQHYHRFSLAKSTLVKVWDVV